MKKLIAISDVETKPYPSIARLKTKRKKLLRSAYYHGTGALINKRYILTAAHNLYHVPFISSFKRALITLGYNQGTSIKKLNKSYKKNSTRCAQGFSFKEFIRDFGIIDLGEEMPDTHNNFRLPKENEIDELFNEGLRLHFAGYPGEVHGGKTLKATYCELTDYKYDGNFFIYQIDSATGNSGGPVWYEKNNEFILVGIHVFEKHAVALNNKNLNEITQWMKD